MKNDWGLTRLHYCTVKILPWSGSNQVKANWGTASRLTKNCHLVFSFGPLFAVHVLKTWFGSPPKFLILSLTHLSASLWSSRPALSPTLSSNRGMKPKGPTLKKTIPNFANFEIFSLFRILTCSSLKQRLHLPYQPWFCHHRRPMKQFLKFKIY